MKLSHSIGTGLAAAVIGVTAVFAAPALTSNYAVADGSGTATHVADGSGPCRPERALMRLGLAPEALRADLREAWGLTPGSDRREALGQIRKQMRQGDYGDAVQAFAENRLKGWLEFWRDAPPELRTDIKALRGVEPGEARRAAERAILDSMLVGDYGAEMAQRAQHLVDHFKECRTDD